MPPVSLSLAACSRAYGPGLQINFRQHVPRDTREPIRPGRLSPFIADQILPDLDNGVCQSPLSPVPPQGIADKLPDVGLVGSDDQIVLCAQCFQKWPGEAVVLPV